MMESEDNPQEDFWEGDVPEGFDEDGQYAEYDEEHGNDTDWHERQVDEFLSLYNLQAQIDLSLREVGDPLSDSEVDVNE